MLSLQLHIQLQTEKRLRKILTYTQDEEMFAQNIRFDLSTGLIRRQNS